MAKTSSVRIALVSYQVKSGDKDGNIQLVDRVLHEYADSKPQLFVFPELNICGWPPQGSRDYARIAERIPDSYSVERIVALASKYRTILCVGFVEESAGLYFITHFLCGPDGYIGKQRKLFPQNPTKDGPFSAGAGISVFHLFGHRCVIMACADWLLPEATYLAGVSKASLILSPTDGMSLPNKKAIRRIALARTMDTGSHLIAAFGGDTPHKGAGAMAGLVAAPTNDGTSKIILLETRRLDEMKVMQVEIALQCPQHSWGGFNARAQTLKNNLEEQILGSEGADFGSKQSEGANIIGGI